MTYNVHSELVNYADQERRVILCSTTDGRYLVESYLYSRGPRPLRYIKHTYEEARDVLLNIIDPKRR